MILLASKSETRRRMLTAAGIIFESIPAPFDEDAEKTRLRAGGSSALEVAEGLAAAKALAAGPQTVLVLGSDQTLECSDGSMLDKPTSRAEAEAQLTSLSGRSHRLHSAAAIVDRGKVVWRATETVTLTMRALTPAFLHAYLDAEYEAIRWSVGGYRIEGPGAQLFTQVDGSHFAVLGLPLLPLLAYLRERQVIPT
ncbi:Maf family protein [Allosphingosinicella vermicomposti]|uniref:Maf family protein n=1 Tax=Allosphingosinicella vermicomposti TaxID=614671 RepID=UPI000D0FDF92|nr:Maf family protein [Allosphingosinicella vermicomposti]